MIVDAKHHPADFRVGHLLGESFHIKPVHELVPLLRAHLRSLGKARLGGDRIVEQNPVLVCMKIPNFALSIQAASPDGTDELGGSADKQTRGPATDHNSERLTNAMIPDCRMVRLPSKGVGRGAAGTLRIDRRGGNDSSKKARRRAGRQTYAATRSWGNQ
jgi:hypothetical protein